MAVLESDWTVDQSVAEMTGAGAFGRDVRFVSFALDDRHAETDCFTSTVMYGTVTVRDQDGTRARRLVIKLKHRQPELRAKFRSHLHFANEILFYERIVPFFAATAPADSCRPSFCRYFYGRNDCGDLSPRDLIVLENDTPRGYRSAVCDHRLFLDFDHVAVALRTLAKFHALSYRAKHVDRSGFEDAIGGIEETQWDADGEWVISADGIAVLLAAVLDKLAERRGADDEPLRRFRAELLADAPSALRRTVEPAEPLAVLCHGDFNRNNVLFRYDGGGTPVDALPFDMATARYGSPALDLSFFLYMNTDRRLRDAHWDRLLDGYCAALAAAVADADDGSGSVPVVPDRAQLDVEMRERAFYGIAHASFFVRTMLDESDPPVDDIMNYATMAPLEYINIFLQIGGDKADDAIADAVQHFIDIKYGDVSAGSSQK